MIIMLLRQFISSEGGVILAYSMDAILSMMTNTIIVCDIDLEFLMVVNVQVCMPPYGHRHTCS